jgi:hypothetical protein
MRSGMRTRHRVNSQIILDYLSDNNLSQKQLASKAGLDPSVPCKILNPFSNKTCDLATIRKLSNATGIPEGELIDDHRFTWSIREIINRLYRRYINEFAHLQDMSHWDPRVRRLIAAKISAYCQEAQEIIASLTKQLAKGNIDWPAASDLIGRLWQLDDLCHLATIPRRVDQTNCKYHFGIGDACQREWLKRMKKKHPSLADPAAREEILHWVNSFFTRCFDYHLELQLQLQNRTMNLAVLQLALESHVQLIALLVEITTPIQSGRS